MSITVCVGESSQEEQEEQEEARGRVVGRRGVLVVLGCLMNRK